MKHFSGRILALVFFILVFSDCRSPTTNTIINIDADNTLDAVDIKLSDLADSFKIIPLETSTECLLDDLTEFYCNEDYILAISENGVFKFTPSGKFVKKLIDVGRGPNEIVNLSYCFYTVDEDNDLLFINDQNHRGVYFRYDLNSEQFLEPVIQWSSAFGFFDIAGDSLIIVTNYFNKEYAFYYQDFNGKFLSGIANTKKLISGKEETLQGGRLSKSGSDYYYSFTYDDTLFKIEDQKLVPYLALNFKTPRENPPKETIENEDYRNIFFQPGASSFLIVHIQTDYLKNLDLNNRRTGESNSYYLLFNNFTGKASRINSYTDNFIGETKDAAALSKFDFLSPFFLKVSANNKIIIPYSPGQIKKAIENGLNYQDFSAEINDQLLIMNETLQETDNPILLIGKIKYNVF